MSGVLIHLRWWVWLTLRCTMNWNTKNEICPHFNSMTRNAKVPRTFTTLRRHQRRKDYSPLQRRLCWTRVPIGRRAELSRAENADVDAKYVGCLGSMASGVVAGTNLIMSQALRHNASTQDRILPLHVPDETHGTTRSITESGEKPHSFVPRQYSV